MYKYIHNVKYYETDRMGITHHSNYVRWMEDARMAYQKSIGFAMVELEKKGVTSPVVSIEGQYKHTTTFDDDVEVEVSVAGYTGVKLTMAYTMRNSSTGEVVYTGHSSHCFINAEGRPIAVRQYFPEFDAALKSLVEPEN